jgi:hypothetical protein
LGNFFLGEFLDGDGGDDEEGYVHGSIRAMVYSYVLRQGIPMSCNHTPPVPPVKSSLLPFTWSFQASTEGIFVEAPYKTR